MPTLSVILVDFKARSCYCQPGMEKKRKTRQEKIITQLRRRLAGQKTLAVSSGTKIEARQEAVFSRPEKRTKKEVIPKKPDNINFYYDPKLVKKDIIKTAILALIVISLELVLYLKLR